MPTTAKAQDNITARNLAAAYVKLAQANHYMLGIAAKVSLADLEDAQQLLIERQNSGPQTGASFRRLGLALDLIETAIADKRFADSHGTIAAAA